jgi:hypothetical protein
MMHQFIVDFELPEEFTEEFISLIPEHRARIDELMENGLVLSYALSVDRSKVWATINATSENEVIEIISSFPLINFMSATVYQLEFYNATGNGLPAISLN